MGKKKQPFYRIVAADSRRARNGRFLETLGTYNPIVQPATINVAEDKLIKWFDQGAEPSDTVRTLLSQIGFMEKYTKMKAGQDVASMELKTTIDERKKRTRKIKKAAVAAAEAAQKEQEAGAAKQDKAQGEETAGTGEEPKEESAE